MTGSLEIVPYSLDKSKQSQLFDQLRMCSIQILFLSKPFSVFAQTCVRIESKERAETVFSHLNPLTPKCRQTHWEITYNNFALSSKSFKELCAKEKNKIEDIFILQILIQYYISFSQKKLSDVWLVSPWLPKPVLRARLKHLLKSIKKEDAALKREGLENLREEQLKAV